MTENEAIEKLHAYLECESRRAKIVSCNENCDDCELCYMQGTGSEHIASVETAIKALEEVQQYRKNGITVKNAVENMCNLICAESLIAEYRAIGTVDECRAAMEKQTAKRPKEYEDKYYACPVCGNVLLHKWEKYPDKLMDKSNGLPYCLGCGQHLDWSDEE